MSEILNFIGHYASQNWDTILTYLLAGGGISVALKFLSRLRKWESAAWKEFVLGLFSAVAALSNWIINNYATSPLASLGNVGPRILVAAMFMHRVAVNPLTSLLENKVAFYLKAGKYYKEELVKESATSQQTPAPDDSATAFVS